MPFDFSSFYIGRYVCAWAYTYALKFTCDSQMLDTFGLFSHQLLCLVPFEVIKCRTKGISSPWRCSA